MYAQDAKKDKKSEKLNTKCAGGHKAKVKL